MYEPRWKALCAALIVIGNASLSLAARNKADSEILAGFDEPIQIFGEMIRNNIDFVDGLNVDVYSPTNRTLVVAKNMRPMSGRYTSGTTGGTYRGVSAYSYVLQTNDVANDVIARVQLPWDAEQLSTVGVEPSNTFVGKLAADNQSWAIAEPKLDVNKAVFKSRINQLTSLAGEYRLIGRVGQEVGNIYQGFGTGPESTIDVLAGGRQDFAFIDGLQFSVFSENNLTMNVDVFSPVPAELIPQGWKSLYAFGYVVNTTRATDLPLGPAAPPSNSSASGAAGLVPSGLGTSRSSLTGSPLPTSTAAGGQGNGLNGIGTPFGGAPPPFPAPGGGKGEGGKGEGDKESRGKGEGDGKRRRRARMLRRQERSSTTAPTPGSSSAALPPPPPGSTAVLPPPAPPASGPGGVSGSGATPRPTAPPPPGPSGTTAALPPPASGSASRSGSQPSVSAAPPALPPPSPAGPSASAITVSTGPPVPAQSGGPREIRAADIQFPINMAVLMKLMGTNQPANLGANNGNGNANQQDLLGESATDSADAMLRNIKFQVARRDVGATTQQFTPFNIGSGTPAAGEAMGGQPNAGGNNGNGAATAAGMRLSIDGGTLRFSGAQQLDGEYVVLVPSEMIAQGQAQNQKGSKNAGSILGVDLTNIGAAFAVLAFAALLI